MKCVAVAGLAFMIAFAQPEEPRFEVASLKPVQPIPPYPIDLGNTNHGRVTLTNVTLSECLRFAFNIHNDSQIQGPDWMRSRTDLFSIAGQAAPDTPKDQLRLMTRALLAERFGLTILHEQRELPYLALVVDRKGLKMREAKDGADASGVNVRSGRIVANMSMTTLSVFLARFTKETVVDSTDLKGAYEVHLEWTPENLNARADDPSSGPSVYAALQEQIGLRLERKKGPLEVVVVERATRSPLGN